MSKKIAFFSLVALFVFGANIAHAATLSGWAWSETFGWISFNSTDAGAGGGPYAVSIDSSGNWSGYAWSENMGWISFNASDVTTNCSGFSAPQLNKTTGAVTGGAYAPALGASLGCIELSGTGHTSPVTGGSAGVTYVPSTGLFVGYAWGGDTTLDGGPGWIQFNPTITQPSTPVQCNSNDCGYTGGGGLTGTCAATTAYLNIPANTNVTFQAAATSGTGPFTYAWNPPPTTYVVTNQFTANYSSSAAGPNVIIKDSTAAVTGTISCPSVTVAAGLGSSNMYIGKTVATANLTSLTVKQKNQFALKWNFTMSDDYSCNPVVSPDPGLSNWNTNWKNASLGNTDNNDGTMTWAGDTGNTLTAGSAINVLSPGIYNFGITCTSPTNSEQNVTNTLKVNLSGEGEI